MSPVFLPCPPDFARCTICGHHDYIVAVPIRDADTWDFDGMCPLCLDGFLGAFPLRASSFRRRETTGRSGRVPKRRMSA